MIKKADNSQIQPNNEYIIKRDPWDLLYTSYIISVNGFPQITTKYSKKKRITFQPILDSY